MGIPVNKECTSNVFIPGLGGIRIKASDRGVTGIQFLRRASHTGRKAGLPRPVPALLRTTIKELRLYAQGRLKRFSVPVDISRVPGFTRRVLLQTKKIPYGRTLSYKQIASAIGSPDASRAVGNSLGKNPVPIIIPCHRVYSRNSFIVVRRSAGTGLGNPASLPVSAARRRN